MATLSVQEIDLTGEKLDTTAAAAGGDKVPNDNGDVFLYVDNTGTASQDVRPQYDSDCDQGFAHEETITVPAGEDRMIGPFPKEHFNDSVSEVDIQYTSETGLQVAAVRLPR